MCKRNSTTISGTKSEKCGKLLTYQLRMVNFENEKNTFLSYLIGMMGATLSNMVNSVVLLCCAGSIKSV